ncbi:MAG: peptidoglycan-binding protein [Clostridia bacterium]|nr:peptidoglycan-binding protein [Clostridia bacterium]
MIGDRGDEVEKINKFWKDVFPAYASVLKRNAYDVLGNYFGENTEAWTKEFQRRTGLKEDGCIGLKTLTMMITEFGFKI